MTASEFIEPHLPKQESTGKSVEFEQLLRDAGKMARMLQAAISGLICDCGWSKGDRCSGRLADDVDGWCAPCLTLAELDRIAEGKGE